MSRKNYDLRSFCADWSESLLTFLPAALQAARNPFAKWQADPIGYCEEILGLSPWPGCEAKGQRELFEDIAESVRLQQEGKPACRIFRIEAGNGVGKTYGGAMLANWFFDCFTPSITTTTAPTKNSVEELLWKDIKKIRNRAKFRGKSLSDSSFGRVLPAEPRMTKGQYHWAIGKTTSDAGGKGEERFKGQHDDFMMFQLDEAEGLSKFVFDAVVRMMTGPKVCITLLWANPRTRTSEFFKWGTRSGVQNYRFSALDHPNIVEGREVVPGATTREWVMERIEEWCEIVPTANEDDYTFTVPWQPGVIYKPSAEFLCAIMGIPPANSSDDTLIPSGRYQGAVERGKAALSGRALDQLISAESSCDLRFGVDAARWGLDYGTIYARLGSLVWRVAKVTQQDTTTYAGIIKAEALRLKALKPGLKTFHVRVDAGGGFGGGVIDQVKNDRQLQAAFPEKGINPEDDAFQCLEVDFGGSVNDAEACQYKMTEMAADAAESLKTLCLMNPPAELEGDLIERKYFWVNVAGKAVKRLESKLEFRKPKRLGRSPDDGDGFFLAVASDFLFRLKVNRVIRAQGAERSRYGFA